MDTLDASLLTATVGGLEQSNKDPQECKEQLINHSLALATSIATVVNSALQKNTAEFGDGVSSTSTKVAALIAATVDAAGEFRFLCFN